MSESKRVAIVTGSSKGIGAAIAERLAADGLATVVNYSSSPEPADDLVSKIKSAGGQAIAVKADVSDPIAVTALFNAAEEVFGGVDVLVNNAGMMKLAPLAEISDEVWSRTLAINLTGPFNGMREAARRLRPGGRIVNLSTSVIGVYPPTYAAYAASKGGLEAVSHILAKELGPRRITVNVVAPGPVATELFFAGKSDADVRSTVGRIPLGRLGEPDDIARVVSFLVGPDGAWINGQVLRANGGMV